MSGRVVHFEIPADDPGRASEFYRSVFGWHLAPMPEVDYIAVSTTPADEQGTPLEPGAINGGMFKRTDNAPRTPVITIDVEDIDSILAKIGAQGGSTVVPRQPVMDMGYFAYFQDSEGNVMGLWQSV